MENKKPSLIGQQKTESNIQEVDPIVEEMVESGRYVLKTSVENSELTAGTLNNILTVVSKELEEVGNEDKDVANLVSGKGAKKLDIETLLSFVSTIQKASDANIKNLIGISDIFKLDLVKK